MTFLQGGCRSHGLDPPSRRHSRRRCRGLQPVDGADEDGTLARLKAHRGDLIDPKIAEHRGRIVKTTGDGLLVEFASVVDALRCAAEVQAAMGRGTPPYRQTAGSNSASASIRATSSPRTATSLATG